ncbi:hypothetical protein FACS189426_00260 [Bacteroidia bacterium]|nr:hypothetical protein FACS189426_00260 [Bacteroidia bacterium]
MFEVISSDKPEKWNEIVRSMKNGDFYHLAEYHQLDDSGTPLLLYYSKNTDAFVLPVILRSIEGTPFCDITSVYGYAGPLTNQDNPDRESVAAFQKELLHFFDANQVVSVFARLHSLIINQTFLLNGLGELLDENLTVGIDLTLPEEKQMKQYSRSLRYRINHLKKIGVSVIQASNKEEIDTFIALYEESMKRVNASKTYFFSREYFYRFLEKIDSVILLAVYEHEIIAGALCTFCGNNMQYHLGGTRNDFLFMSPLKLVLDRARCEGIARGMKMLHLGGGKGGLNDSLFVFKSRFSNRRFVFKTWRYIHNKAVYDMLIYDKYKENKPEITFFPLYRA